MNTIGYSMKEIEGKEVYRGEGCRRGYRYLGSILNSASSRRGKKESEVMASIDRLVRESNRGLMGLFLGVSRQKPTVCNRNLRGFLASQIRGVLPQTA